jgi:hypothetical protein
MWCTPWSNSTSGRVEWARGVCTDHARKTLRRVSRFAGMHIGQHVEPEAVEAARGEAPQERNTMKLSAIHAWGVAIVAATSTSAVH